MSVIDLTDLVKDYPVGTRFFRRARGVLRAVDHVTLQVGDGETVGLVGESGSGKTTVGKLALRLVEPTSGRIHFLNQPIERLSEREMRPLRSKMSMIFQDPYASLNPRRRIEYILSRPFELHLSMTSSEVRRNVLNLLERVGLSPADDFATKFPHQLSGGQRQRVAVARAVALRPKLIVADEPVSSLDVSVSAQILNLLSDLQADLGVSYLFITHDLSIVHSISDRLAVMYQGQIVEEGPTSEVLLRPSHPYTQLLVSSTPELLRQHTRNAGLRENRTEGEMTEARDRAGCRFRARCPYAMPRCHVKEPELLQVGDGHRARCFLLEERSAPAAWLAARTWAGSITRESSSEDSLAF